MNEFTVKSKVKGVTCPDAAYKCSRAEYFESINIAPADIPKEAFTQSGYLLRWGEVLTWISEAEFNLSYEPEKVNVKQCDFGEALNLLREGRKVARAGWNGKGMFLYLALGSTVDSRALKLPVKKALSKVAGDKVRINGHIDMYAADGSIVVGWLASQTDMLACDWYEVE